MFILLTLVIKQSEYEKIFNKTKLTKIAQKVLLFTSEAVKVCGNAS